MAPLLIVGLASIASQTGFGLFNIFNNSKLKKLEEKARGRVVKWQSWFDKACTENKTPAQVILEGTGEVETWVKKYASIQDWLNQNPNWQEAYNYFITHAAQKGLSYNKKPCNKAASYVYLGIGVFLILILLIIIKKKKK